MSDAVADVSTTFNNGTRRVSLIVGLEKTIDSGFLYGDGRHGCLAKLVHEESGVVRLQLELVPDHTVYPLGSARAGETKEGTFSSDTPWKIEHGA